MMNQHEHPLVSCIMPTYNRRPFVSHAIRYFLRQDYGNKELIIVDDGSDPVQDLVSVSDRIRYFRLDKKISLGAKLNLACQYARGDLIANWDDDDWYAERRLRYQIDTLRNGATDLCGINRLIYYDLLDRRGYQYIYPASERIWLLGSSLCYTRELWERNHFADRNVGMDALFVWAAPPERVRALPDPTISVHMIHDSNVSPKRTDNSWWHAYPVNEIQKIVDADWHFYNTGSAASPATPPSAAAIQHPATPARAVPPPRASFQNIFACLIHENEDCIIDLVRNLHYQDPGSIIILYNGGEDKNLIRPDFPFEKFGAILHPDPVPVKHGYLHPFALKCMEFALENFSFDTLTIVDSDQLCIRPGYTQYLEKFFRSSPRTGMLSSMREKVTADNKKVYTAIQAFKEYELWRPLLKEFPQGEDKFVHWTFWPSTVFSKEASRDLIRLFSENELLKKIMQQTKIWATEEIILPTLVSLLGYPIAENPCSYEYVKYKKIFAPRDIGQALNRNDAYWIHPIERKYEEPLRKQLRQQFSHYAPAAPMLSAAPAVVAEAAAPEPAGVDLIGSIRKIEGWLEDGEAELLLAVAKKVCENSPAAVNIVEIGSYHGKSTILFGSMARAFSPRARVFAIDPHDGKLGATDQGLQIFPPSFDRLKRNIADAGLSGFVEIIKDRSYNVSWRGPIALLFIDGLHDYPNTARDFWHFSDWVTAGGYICFHDYADYYPGVKAFVHELLADGHYRKTSQAGSLILIQKL